jgi:hypothetical protein
MLLDHLQDFYPKYLQYQEKKPYLKGVDFFFYIVLDNANTLL